MANNREWIEQFRMLKTGTQAGLGLAQLWKKLGNTGPRGLRLDNQTIAAVLDRGEGLSQAMDLVPHWPPMVRVLLRLGDESSHLPEICAELVRHFETIQTNQRLFWSKAFWPLLQLIMAVGIIGLLILILGYLPASRHGGYDPLGLGLKGPTGLAIYLGGVALVGLGLAGLFWGIRLMVGSGGIDRWLDRIPLLGPTRNAFAMGRFCMALGLLGKTGLAWDKALRFALDATQNSDWMKRGSIAIQRIKKGRSVTTALAETGLFQDEILGQIGVGEESGSLPESLDRMADVAFEEGRHRLSILAVMAAQLAWFCTAGIIIFFIVRLFSSYISQISQIGG